MREPVTPLRRSMSGGALIERLFAISPDVRYVALYRDGELEQRSRPAQNASSSESDRYEELLVNPALLLLTQQRGDIDCGGLRYVVVRYGDFFQLVVPTDGGHASICFEPHGDPVAHADRILEVAAGVRAHG